MKPGSNCCWLPSKSPEECEEQIEEVIASLSGTKDTSVDAAVVAGWNFHIENRTMSSNEGFSQWTLCYHSIPKRRWQVFS